ncbi:MAG: cupin domain-containing protein [Acidobacteriota bacterium]
MRRQLMCLVGVTGMIVIGALYVKVNATPQFGFTASTIAKGRFGDIDVANQLVRRYGDATPQKDLWLSLQKTKGPSDLYVQNNEWAVGGSTGWHTHPGHSLIIVTAGTVTAYEGDSSTCTATQYGVGTGFVDPGGNHVHLIRNEGSVVARTIAVQLVAADAQRREDITPGPAGCPF